VELICAIDKPAKKTRSPKQPVANNLIMPLDSEPNSDRN
jgi:hypothetical protein